MRSHRPARRIFAITVLSLSAAVRAAAQVTDAEFVVIRPGTFRMGSRLGDDRQRPIRTVTLTRAFSLQKTQVSQEQWLAVMGTNPSVRRFCIRCPVDNVSYDDVQRFIARLNARSTAKYRLPTEAEWEYAARAGQDGDFRNPGAVTHGGSIENWATGPTLPVGSQAPNAWGVHDMEGFANSGAVWEWVSDWYGPFPSAAVKDPVGPQSGNLRVLRGGAFQVSAAFPGATCRRRIMPWKTCVARVSFRLVREDDPG